MSSLFVTLKNADSAGRKIRFLYNAKWRHGFITELWAGHAGMNQHGLTLQMDNDAASEFKSFNLRKMTELEVI